VLTEAGRAFEARASERARAHLAQAYRGAGLDAVVGVPPRARGHSGSRAGIVSAPSGWGTFSVVDDDDRLRDPSARVPEPRRVSRSPWQRMRAPRGRMLELLDFDLLIVDVMMPVRTGSRLTRHIREAYGQARADPHRARLRPATGSRDSVKARTTYLAKPFEPQELLLRVAAILRRAGRAADGPRRLSLGEYAFDLDRSELLRGEELIRLTEARRSCCARWRSRPTSRSTAWSSRRRRRWHAARGRRPRHPPAPQARAGSQGAPLPADRAGCPATCWRPTDVRLIPRFIPRRWLPPKYWPGG
jgi:two-component system phosphate regulon response regulator OmpR